MARKTRILVLGPFGAYSRRQTVKKANLGKYTRINFRGKPTYVQKETLEQLAQEADAKRDNERPVGRTPFTPQERADVATEEFFVRDDYKGGGVKRDSQGKAKGRHKPVSVNVRVLFTGTRRERDEAFDRMFQMFTSNMPFLNRRGGLIGRERVDVPRHADRVRVIESRLDGRPNGAIRRSVFFDLEAI